MPRAGAELDRPLESINTDLLDREDFIKRLATTLVSGLDQPGDNRRATGHVVGLTGPWGAGKSTILNFLAEYLGKLSNVSVVRFNPWLFSGRDDLIVAFLGQLRATLGQDIGGQARSLFVSLDRYRELIATTADSVIAPGSGSAVRSLPRTAPPAADTVRAELEERIQSLNRAIIVIIDELDRVENEEVRAVARLIKAVGDIRGISYLVAYDHDRVIEALGGGARGAAYLEKVIQLAIPLRPLFTDDVDRLLPDGVGVDGWPIWDGVPSRKQALFEILRNELKTPRDVKRLLGTFEALMPMVEGEVGRLEVLAYSYLVTKAPALRAKLSDRIDYVVDDASGRTTDWFEFFAQQDARKEPPPLVCALGEEALEHKALLTWLFPRFGSSRDPVPASGDRLSERANLVTMIYLGDPPGIVPRKTIRTLYAETADNIESCVRTLVRDARFQGVTYRLRSMLPELSMQQDATFWPSVSRGLIRETEWLEGLDPARGIGDELEVVIRRLALHGPIQTNRAKSIAQSLRNAGDLSILPELLRPHIIHFGIGLLSRPYDLLIWTREESQELIALEAPRYRRALIDGSMFRLSSNLAGLYALLNLDMYDEELRQAVTGQLSNADAIGTFAALLLPPGVGIEPQTLRRILDCTAVTGAVERLLTEGAFEARDPQLAQAVERFRSALRDADGTAEEVQ